MDSKQAIKELKELQKSFSGYRRASNADSNFGRLYKGVRGYVEMLGGDK